MTTLLSLIKNGFLVLENLLGNFWQTVNSDAFRQDISFLSSLCIIVIFVLGFLLLIYYQWKVPHIKLRINIRKRPRDRMPHLSPKIPHHLNVYAISVAFRNEGADIAKGLFFYLAFNELVEVKSVDFFPDAIQNPAPGKSLFLYNHPYDLPNWAPWIEYFGLKIDIKKADESRPFVVGRVDYQGGGEKKLNHNWIYFNPTEEKFFFEPIKDIKREMRLGKYKSDSNYDSDI